MPLYRYECEKCAKIEEHLQKLHEPPMTECAACSGPLHKLLSTPTPIFRGVGWGKDGYGAASMGKQGPLASEVAAEMAGRGADAAKTGGHVEGRKAVNQYLDKLEGKDK